MKKICWFTNGVYTLPQTYPTYLFKNEEADSSNHDNHAKWKTIGVWWINKLAGAKRRGGNDLESLVIIMPATPGHPFPTFSTSKQSIT